MKKIQEDNESMCRRARREGEAKGHRRALLEVTARLVPERLQEFYAMEDVHELQASLVSTLEKLNT